MSLQLIEKAFLCRIPVPYQHKQCSKLSRRLMMGPCYPHRSEVVCPG